MGYLSGLVSVSLFLGVAGVAGVARADDSVVSYTVEVASMTSYVWRGDRVSSTSMRPVVQPYAELNVSAVGPGSFTVGMWSSSSLAETVSAEEFDPYVAYTLPVGPTALRAGYVTYLVPASPTVDSGHEFSLQATATWAFPIKPFVGLVVDPIRSEGFYGFGGATYSVSEGSFGLTTTLNVGGSQYRGLDASLQDVTLTARGSYGFGDSGAYVAVTAVGAYSGRSDEVYPTAGLSFGVSR